MKSKSCESFPPSPSVCLSTLSVEGQRSGVELGGRDRSITRASNSKPEPDSSSLISLHKGNHKQGGLTVACVCVHALTFDWKLAGREHENLALSADASVVGC